MDMKKLLARKKEAARIIQAEQALQTRSVAISEPTDGSALVLYRVNVPSTTIKLSGGVRVTAANHILSLTAQQAEEFDALRASPNRADLRQMFQKVDMDAATRIGREFLKNRNKAAVKGPFTSDDRIDQNTQAQRAETLTGSSNPVNTSEDNRTTAPLEVEEFNLDSKKV